jgi:Tfp pilus assembly protein PilW
MSRRLASDERGITLLELLIVVVVGTVVLFGLSFLYVATVRAFGESSSQAALQRVGALTLQTITRRAQLASAIALNPSPACAPGGTTGRTLQLTLTDIAPTSLPASQMGTYCYYSGNGANGAPAGALCQRFTPTGGAPGACWNLLAAAQPGLVHKTGQTAGVVLIRQTTPANTFCPQNTMATDVNGAVVSAVGPIATGVYCLDLAQVFPPPGQAGNVTGNVAFGITDGLSSMTFTASLMRRN